MELSAAWALEKPAGAYEKPVRLPHQMNLTGDMFSHTHAIMARAEVRRQRVRGGGHGLPRARDACHCSCGAPAWQRALCGHGLVARRAQPPCTKQGRVVVGVCSTRSSTRCTCM